MGCRDCIHGAIGLAKVAMGVDRADAATIEQRRDICRGCEHATRSSKPKFEANQGLTNMSRCQLCNCFIAGKTVLRGEACPAGKWASVSK